MIFIHILEVLPTNAKYPYLYNLGLATYSFIGLCYIWVFLLKKFYELNPNAITFSKFFKEKTR